MRTHLSATVEKGRVRHGPWASTLQDGPNGVFLVRGPTGDMLDIGANNGEAGALIGNGKRASAPTGWEHVVVSTEHRTPTWEEMSFVKDLFWSEEEPAMQLHPPRSQYVNGHPYRLHLWKPKRATIPMPPQSLVALGYDPKSVRG